MTLEKLQLVQHLAIQNLKEIPHNTRTKGMKRDLSERERITLSWIMAVQQAGSPEVELEFNETSSCWEP